MVPLPVLVTPPAFATINVVNEPLVPTTRSPARLVVVAVMVFVVPSATSCARTDIAGSVTLSTFLSRKEPSSAAYTGVQSSSVSAFVLFGVLARFDMFGHADGEPMVLARNAAPEQR